VSTLSYAYEVIELLMKNYGNLTSTKLQALWLLPFGSGLPHTFLPQQINGNKLSLAESRTGEIAERERFFIKMNRTEKCFKVVATGGDSPCGGGEGRAVEIFVLSSR
jgi:hypothetical protein